MRMQRLCFIFTGTLLLLITNTWTNWRQKEPYMDELFHVPQAQQFCESIVENRIPTYHHAITTLPGVYLIPAVLALIISPKVCDTSFLRIYSSLIALLCLPLLNAILKLLYVGQKNYPLNTEQVDSYPHWYLAFIVWLHPVFLFYANLYYTDTSSVFFILLTWYLSLKGSNGLSAVTGCFAALCRQTNIVWHAFIVCDHLLHSTQVKSAKISIQKYIRSILQYTLSHLWQHALVGVVYVLFLIINGGVAIGDKENHRPIIHYAMFPYFLGFHTISFALFHLLRPYMTLKYFVLIFRNHALLVRTVISVTVITTMVMKTGDYAHPFVLSDNRHYTFYLYKRILLRSGLVRLLLVPLYAWTVFTVDSEFCALRDRVTIAAEKRNENSQPLTKTMSLQLQWLDTEQLLDILLFIFVGVTLIPSPLLELRYFVTASMFLSIRRLARFGEGFNRIYLGLASLVCILANLAFVWVFNERTFQRPVDPHMPSDLSPGRFML